MPTPPMQIAGIAIVNKAPAIRLSGMIENAVGSDLSALDINPTGKRIGNRNGSTALKDLRMDSGMKRVEEPTCSIG